MVPASLDWRRHKAHQADFKNLFHCCNRQSMPKTIGVFYFSFILEWRIFDSQCSERGVWLSNAGMRIESKLMTVGSCGHRRDGQELLFSETNFDTADLGEHPLRRLHARLGWIKTTENADFRPRKRWEIRLWFLVGMCTWAFDWTSNKGLERP